MVFREVSVIEVREVLRGWLGGAGLRTVAGQAGVDRKTARRYVAAAEAAGVCREGGLGQLTDEVIGQVVVAVRPVRTGGHGPAWEALEAERVQISEWVGKDLTVVKIADLLARRGVLVPYRTLHRFCTQRCGFGGGGATTVRVADGEPGVECQIDFAKMGLVYDPGAGRRRVAHALIFTAVCSRHMFVWLTFSQTLAAVIEGCEAAWRFFGGVFRVLVPDNAAAIVAKADAVNPRFTIGWLDYTQHCGFSTDAARVRSPKDKPRVERAVQYVRGSFFAGEDFVDLADAQVRVEKWCRETAGGRIHGTTAARPAEVFAEHEAPALLPVPEAYDVPIFTRVKVHRDFHIEVGKALYSAPRAYLGAHVDVRADSALVKLFHCGQLVKVHPRQRPGGRVTDPEDLPEHKAGYALRDLDRLIAAARKHGPDVGIYAQRLLDDTLPWTRMRQVYRLLALARRYGDTPVNTACGRALGLDVVSVTKIASMLEAASENTPPPPPRPVTVPVTRFARDPTEYTPARPIPTPLTGDQELR
ncbi:MAG: IS21 family transposase [Pseudonocardiaceae bacterium]